MSSLYTANLQIDKEGDLVNPYVKNMCRTCMYCESRKGNVSISIYYCTLKNRFVSPNSVKECFKKIKKGVILWEK